MSTIKISKSLVEMNLEILSQSNPNINPLEPTELLLFNHHSIYNPYRDETDRFDVDPLQYYNIEII